MTTLWKQFSVGQGHKIRSGPCPKVLIYKVYFKLLEGSIVRKEKSNKYLVAIFLSVYEEVIKHISSTFKVN